MRCCEERVIRSIYFALSLVEWLQLQLLSELLMKCVFLWAKWLDIRFGWKANAVPTRNFSFVPRELSCDVCRTIQVCMELLTLLWMRCTRDNSRPTCS